MAAPPGNRYAKRAAVWRDALDRALASMDEGKTQGSTLFHIATGVVQRALEGDPKAIEELSNRLDGRWAQAVTIMGDEANPLITKVVREIVRPDPESAGS